MLLQRDEFMGKQFKIFHIYGHKFICNRKSSHTSLEIERFLKWIIREFFSRASELSFWKFDLGYTLRKFDFTEGYFATSTCRTGNDNRRRYERKNKVNTTHPLNKLKTRQKEATGEKESMFDFEKWIH